MFLLQTLQQQFINQKITIPRDIYLHLYISLITPFISGRKFEGLDYRWQKFSEITVDVKPGSYGSNLINIQFSQIIHKNRTQQKSHWLY